MKIDGKKKRGTPFYPTGIFIFACFLKVAIGASYRQLEKFLGV